MGYRERWCNTGDDYAGSSYGSGNSRAGNVKSFNHQDGHGSVIALSGSNGWVTEKDAYDGWGQTSTPSGNPSGPDATGNLYAYGDNDPINETDPSGLIATGARNGFAAGWNGNDDGFWDVMGGGNTAQQVGAGLGLLGGNVANSAAEVVESSALFGGIGRIAGAFGSGAAEGALLPARLARVVPAEFANSATLAAPGAADAFVTSANDIAGLNSGRGLAERLTLVDSSGNLIPGGRAIIEFDTPAEGLASPVFRTNPGFVGGGVTAGGAVEYVLPNLPIGQLQNVTTRIVTP